MSFKQLYEDCQKLELHVGRNFIRDRVVALSETNQTVSIMKAGLDTTVCRGFYLSSRNLDHPVVRQHGGHVIVVARELNRCWTRFVVVKELMHLLDGGDSATDTGDAFEDLLNVLTGPGASDGSSQVTAEIDCFWKALACLCPEERRVEFGRDRTAGKISEYEIALKCRIPEQYVPQLFSREFVTFRDQYLA